MLAALNRNKASRTTQRSRFEGSALAHLSALYGTALRLTHNDKDAEDLVQDTLLRAYQSFDGFVGEEHCKAWLFKILTNTFINKYRRRILERSVAESMAKEGSTGMMSADALRLSRSLEETLQASLLSDDVQRALTALPEEFRLAVLLCDLEDFSYKEIADIMDCPVGTVMSRLHRGRRLLQAALRGYAEQEGIVKVDGKGDGASVIPLRKAAGERGRGQGGQGGVTGGGG